MSEVTVHILDTVQTRHGFIQGGSQLILPEAEAENLIDRGFAKEVITPERGEFLADVTAKERRRRNGRKMADRVLE